MTPPFKPRHFIGVASLVFAVSMLKGVRMPNLWSATHMTFNYSEGFIRRGLIGELLRTVAGPGVFTYNRLAICAGLLFVAVALAMAALIRRVFRTDRGDLGLQAEILVFAASPGIVVFTHLVGYLDDAGLLLVLGVILLSVGSKRPALLVALTVPVGVILALIHESLVLMFAPTLLFAMICRIAREVRDHRPDRRARLAMAAQALLAVASAFVATSVVGVLGTRSPARIQALKASIERTANFPLRADAFETLYRPVHDALYKLMPEFWSNPINQTYLVLGILTAVPAIAFLLAHGVVLLGRLGLTTRARVIVTVALFVATLAPLSLNFLGWDTARWSAISLIDGFCCVAIVRLTFATRGQIETETAAAGAGLRVDSPLFLSLAAAAVVCGLCSASYDRFLFDGYVVQWFPFQGVLDSFIDLCRGRFTFIPRT